MGVSTPRHPQFLVVRHSRWTRHFFDVILNWIGQHFPEHRQLFDVWDLPDETARDYPYLPHLAAWRSLLVLAKSIVHRERDPQRILRGGVPNGRDYRLHLPWLQDPVQEWSPATFARACSLTSQCDALGIPTINRVDRLVHAVKSTAASLIAKAGVGTPRMEVVRDVREFHETQMGMSLPLFVREDWGHRGGMWRADTVEELRRLPVSRLKRPVAVEIVDVRDPRDGLFRKYRYIAAGEVGVSHHLQTSSGWVTRGENRVKSETTRAEELQYIQHLDPRHDELQRARRALGLVIVAFDYGLTPDGRLIICEANPFPHIKFSQRGLVYRNDALHRTMLAIFRLYLTVAGLAVPQQIEDGLVYPHKPDEAVQRAA
jgi:hypothetical protein